MNKTKKLFNILFISCLTLCSILCLSSCNNFKGKYFVPSEYIMAHASLTSTTTSSDGSIVYGIDIIYDSDITLNYIKYECNLYKNNKIIQTFTDEVPINGLYSMFIPLKTTNEYDFARVVCTGWSDENPNNFMRLRAKSRAEMLSCNHEYIIDAQINSISTNNKKDYMVINFESQTSYNSFRLMYDDYYSISGDVKVCMACGYYEKK